MFLWRVTTLCYACVVVLNEQGKCLTLFRITCPIRVTLCCLFKCSHQLSLFINSVNYFPNVLVSLPVASAPNFNFNTIKYVNVSFKINNFNIRTHRFTLSVTMRLYTLVCCTEYRHCWVCVSLRTVARNDAYLPIITHSMRKTWHTFYDSGY